MILVEEEEVNFLANKASRRNWTMLTDWIIKLEKMQYKEISTNP